MKIPEQCLECDEGRYEVVVKDHTHRGSDSAAILVPGVKFIRCTHCGEELIPAESGRYISGFVAEANEQLTKAELFSMLEASGLSQKDFAEAIGLGEKTFHRWLKGTQVVSRSMGYYLRAIARFPETFKWVLERKWREPAAKAHKWVANGKSHSVRFQALEGRSGRIIRPMKNPARGFSAVRFVMHSS
jgi:YgiT-type zinc finger domain-containing protein